MINSTMQKVGLVLAGVGILVSIWLVSIHIGLEAGDGSIRSNCAIVPIGDSQGCEKVAVSSFSNIADIPLAAFALGYYLAVIALLLSPLFSFKPPREPFQVATSLSAFGLLVTVFMILISTLIVKAFCQGCFLLWVINFALFPVMMAASGFSWKNVFGKAIGLMDSCWDRRLIQKSIGTAFTAVVIAVIGTLIYKSSRMQSERFGGPDRAIRAYNKSKKLYIPEAIWKGFQVKGGENANPVLRIVEFSDFQCPACKMAAAMMKPFLLKYKDRVVFSYRHFPLDGKCNTYAPSGGHRLACFAAKAAYCAGEQGQFFPYHDIIFDNQDSLKKSSFAEFAEKLGLNKSSFNACIEADSTRDAIEQDMTWANSVGLSSTPTLIINGRKIPGALTPMQWQAIFDGVLAGTLKKD